MRITSSGTRRRVRRLLPAGCALAALACGGQSLTNGQGSHGAGAPGEGGSGGLAAGGAAAGVGGTSASGGIGFAGGSGMGAAGRGQGGGSSGNVGIAGSGLVAGQGGAASEVCSLPLETGPCEAAIARYGFNPKTQRCESFVYGGCAGNGNNFETFEACTAACGLANESGCPGGMPDNGTTCAGPSHPCDYSGVNRCLCQPVLESDCQPISSASSCSGSLERRAPRADGGASDECTEPGCVAEVVIISYYTCTCDASWTCVVGAATGGR